MDLILRPSQLTPASANRLTAFEDVAQPHVAQFRLSWKEKRTAFAQMCLILFDFLRSISANLQGLYLYTPVGSMAIEPCLRPKMRCEPWDVVCITTDSSLVHSIEAE